MEKIEATFPISGLTEPRVFETGATRDGETGKLEYFGFVSPIALKRYCEYMHSHRTQSDGKLRSSRNWRKGIPLEAYEESLGRHVVDTVLHLEGFSGEASEPLEEAICGIIFNAMGLLHEIVLKRKGLERGRT